MSDAQTPPPRDTSFLRSLLRNAAGAVGLVVLVAAIFGVLGMIGRADLEAPPIAGVDEADGVAEEAPSEAAPPDPEEPAGEEPASAEETPPAEDPADGGESTTEDPADGGESATEEPASAEETPPSEDPVEEPAEEEPAPPPAATIDPAGISVQVLDGFRQDGGAAASAVASELEAAGYRIVARNPAIAYEVTTVLWTSGFEAEGRQVAAAIGAPDAREQPGNLSNQVNVHVVVGSDRG